MPANPVSDPVVDQNDGLDLQRDTADALASGCYESQREVLRQLADATEAPPTVEELNTTLMDITSIDYNCVIESFIEAHSTTALGLRSDWGKQLSPLGLRDEWGPKLVPYISRIMEPFDGFRERNAIVGRDILLIVTNALVDITTGWAAIDPPDTPRRPCANMKMHEWNGSLLPRIVVGMPPHKLSAVTQAISPLITRDLRGFYCTGHAWTYQCETCLSRYDATYRGHMAWPQGWNPISPVERLAVLGIPSQDTGFGCCWYSRYYEHIPKLVNRNISAAMVFCATCPQAAPPTMLKAVGIGYLDRPFDFFNRQVDVLSAPPANYPVQSLVELAGSKAEIPGLGREVIVNHGARGLPKAKALQVATAVKEMVCHQPFRQAIFDASVSISIDGQLMYRGDDHSLKMMRTATIVDAVAYYLAEMSAGYICPFPADVVSAVYWDYPYYDMMCRCMNLKGLFPRARVDPSSRMPYRVLLEKVHGSKRNKSAARVCMPSLYGRSSVRLATTNMFPVLGDQQKWYAGTHGDDLTRTTFQAALALGVIACARFCGRPNFLVVGFRKCALEAKQTSMGVAIKSVDWSISPRHAATLHGTAGSYWVDKVNNDGVSSIVAYIGVAGPFDEPNVAYVGKHCLFETPRKGKVVNLDNWDPINDKSRVKSYATEREGRKRRKAKPEAPPSEDEDEEDDQGGGRLPDSP